jgi:hypothetical protein
MTRPTSPANFSLPFNPIHPTGKSPKPCQALFAKIFCFSEHPNQRYIFSRPAPTRGAYRDRHETRGGMRWTWAAPGDLLIADEWCVRGRRSRVVLTPSRRCQVSGDEPRATVAIERGSPGRARGSRNTIARGTSGDPGVFVVTMLVCFSTFLHARLRVPCAPGVPCALISLTANGSKHAPGAMLPRECGGVFARRDRGGCLKIESASVMPRLSEVARALSVCAHAGNASLPIDRFAAAH